MNPRLQRVLLLLGALATFLLFAPRGLLIGSLALVVTTLLVGAKRRRRGRPVTPGSDAAARLRTATGAAALGGAAGSLGAIDAFGGDSDGDWGPALVLVFEARDPVTEQQRLRIQGAGSGAWMLEEVDSKGDAAEASPGSAVGCSEILSRLRDAGLQYRLGPSETGEYIFCVVRLPELTARVALSFYPLYLQLDAERARTYAADLGMPLARVGLAEAESSMPRVGSRRLTPTSRFASIYGELAVGAAAATDEGLPAEVWDDLFVRFSPTLPSALFQHFALIPDLPEATGTSPPLSRDERDEESDEQSEVGTLKDCENGGGLWYMKLSAQPRPPMRTTPAYTGSVGALTSVLPPAGRLRLLFSLVSDELPGAFGKRGPGLKLDEWRRPKLCNCLLHTFKNFGLAYSREGAKVMQQLEAPGHFVLYFLLQDPRDVAHKRLSDRFARPATRLFWRSLFTGVADPKLPGLLLHYYGEQIAFYFAFKQHIFGYGVALSILLAPLLALYSLEWARHLELAVGEAIAANAAQPGRSLSSRIWQVFAGYCSQNVAAVDMERSRWPMWSLVIGMTVIVWGQCLIDSWRRQEQRLAKEWGCHRSAVRRAPRPQFRGRVVLSRVDGRLTLQHWSKAMYWAKVVAANLLFFALTLILLQLVRLSWFYKLEQRMAGTRGDFAALGALYTILTVLIFQLFKIVAFLLTQAEDHKHEEHWEASLLVKRLELTIVVECWAVFYLLFVRPCFLPCAYGDNAVREQLGVSHCAPGDGACCDVELRRGVEWLVSFAQLRDEEVVRQTREFVAGWLASKIVLANFMKWFMPRLCGFMCNRGLYPFFAFDFADGLLRGWTGAGRRGPRSAPRRRCGGRFACCRCPKRQAPSGGHTGGRTEWQGKSKLPKKVAKACEYQLDKQDPWDVLDSVSDLSVAFFVTSFTTVIYPFAPVLFLAHVLVEFQMDLVRLCDRRQPKPRVVRGLPDAWLYIFQSYVWVGALSNLAVITWRTPLVRDLFGEANSGTRWAFFSTSMLLLVLIVGLVHRVIPPVPRAVAEHLQRQEEVEAFLSAHRHPEGARVTRQGTTMSCAGEHVPMSSWQLGAPDESAQHRRSFGWSPWAWQREDRQLRSLWANSKAVR